MIMDLMKENLKITREKGKALFIIQTVANTKEIGKKTKWKGKAFFIIQMVANTKEIGKMAI